MATLVTLVDFDWTNGGSPFANLTTDANGDLFGTTASGESGGANEQGEVFELANLGSAASPSYAADPTILASFPPLNAQDLEGPVVADANGDLFGVTGHNGAANDGTVFEIKNTGTAAAPSYANGATTLFSFNGSDGAFNGSDEVGPTAGLLVDANGDLFGATEEGGAYGDGAVFELKNNGTAAAPSYASAPTVLVSFNSADGYGPECTLIADANGDLFGTTSGAGAYDYGNVFEIKNNGTAAAPSYASVPTILASFTDANGAWPYAGLVADSKGDLFGTTEYGGANGDGVVFEIKNTGTIAAPKYAVGVIDLVSFNGADGSAPAASLIVDADGDLFGTTISGGVNGAGTVFEIKNTGTVASPSYASTPTTLVSFASPGGLDVQAGLVADANGNLFVTTPANGADDAGTVLEISGSGFVPFVVPALAITAATLASNQTSLTLSGTIDAADTGATISLYDGSKLLGSTTANASGAWSATVAVSSAGAHTLTAQATNASGLGTSNRVTDLLSASASLSGGGQIVLFSGSGDSVTLSGASGGSDSVTGSNGVVNLSSAQAKVSGGGDGVTFASGSSDTVSLYSTGGSWDWVTGSSGTINLNSAQTTVTGGGDGISFAGGSGNAVGLYSTGGAWDGVNGSSGTVYLTSAQTTVTGGGDWIDFAGGSGNAVGLYSTGGAWDGVSASNGTIYLTSAQTTVTGGGDWIDFAAGSGNAVGLYSTGGAWDGVSGSNGTIYLTSAQTTVTGGGDWIDFAAGSGNAVGLYSTGGVWDGVSGSNGTIYLTSAQTTVTGGGDWIDFAAGSGNAVGLYSTGGVWDGVSGSNGTIYLTSAQTTVTGGGDWIDFAAGSGNAVGLYSTGGSWDGVTASNGAIYLTSAQTTVTGGGDWIDFAGGSGNAVGLYSTGGVWDGVSGSNGAIYLTSAQATVTGGGDWIVFVSGSGNAVSLYSTGGNWDGVTASNGTIYLTSAQTTVTGGGDTIDFSGGSGNAVGLYSTSGDGDTVNGSNGTVYLTSAQATVTGGGDTIDFSGGSENSVALYSTSGNRDTVNGSNGTVTLISAQATVNGTGDSLELSGTSVVTANGGSDTFVFGAAIGAEVINDFASTDSIQFNRSDFASWSALQGDMSQSGANTVITLDANDTVTLTNVALSSLTSSQFSFYTPRIPL